MDEERGVAAARGRPVQMGTARGAGWVGVSCGLVERAGDVCDAGTRVWGNFVLRKPHRRIESPLATGVAEDGG